MAPFCVVRVAVYFLLGSMTVSALANVFALLFVQSDAKSPVLGGS
jgi:hypothetical protein